MGPTPHHPTSIHGPTAPSMGPAAADSPTSPHLHPCPLCLYGPSPTSPHAPMGPSPLTTPGLPPSPARPPSPHTHPRSPLRFQPHTSPPPYASCSHPQPLTQPPVGPAAPHAAPHPPKRPAAAGSPSPAPPASSWRIPSCSGPAGSPSAPRSSSPRGAARWPPEKGGGASERSHAPFRDGHAPLVTTPTKLTPPLLDNSTFGKTKPRPPFCVAPPPHKLCPALSRCPSHPDTAPPPMV